MNSIEIGKVIYDLLAADSTLTHLVGNKIYPIMAEHSTTYPFIIYQRSNIIPNYTKDIHLSDDVVIDMVCISDDYKTGVEIAKIVRERLEDKKFRQYGIESIKLDSAFEDYTNDAFVQTLGFTITINQ